MNYLTNHYRNQVEALSQKVNLLENRLASIARMSGGVDDSGPTNPQSPFGTPTPAGPGINYPTVAGNAGGPGTPNTFSGLILGQLLGSGNMDAVYQYLSQFFGNDITSMNAILSSYGYSIPTSAGPGGGEAGGPGGAGQAYSGAVLGNLLGQGNMNAVNQYLGQFGGQYPTQAGPAAVSSNINKARSARRGGVRAATGR